MFLSESDDEVGRFTARSALSGAKQSNIADSSVSGHHLWC